MDNLKELTEQEISDKGQHHLQAVQRCLEEMLRRNCAAAAQATATETFQKCGCATSDYRKALGHVIIAWGHATDAVMIDPAEVTPSFGGS